MLYSFVLIVSCQLACNDLVASVCDQTGKMKYSAMAEN